MAKTDKKGKITIANIIAMVGICLLAIYSYMGNSYLSGGETGTDIIKTAVLIGITTFLLWFLIKAKGAENNIKKWKMLEIGTLVVYIIIAIATSLFGGVMHYFVVNDNKDEIERYAAEDLARIDTLIAEYKTYERGAIEQSVKGLKNAISRKYDESVENFMTENAIIKTNASIDVFNKICNDTYLGRADSVIKNYNKEKENINIVIDNWNTMLIASKAKQISILAEEMETFFTKLSHSEKHKLPYIVLSESNPKIFTITHYQSKDFKIEGDFKFKNAIMEAEGFSTAALFMVIFIHLLILFNYIVAYRTATIGVGKNYEEDGGIILY